MNKEDPRKTALDFYYQNTTALKEKKRTGWIYWSVSGERIESIPEHIWGTQMLAWAMWSEFELNVDIFKVNAILSLHEEEEIEIGDITPFDKVTKEEKARRGKVAVEHICGNLKKGEFIKDLIAEFEAQKTAEAKFAYWCDKMECDLQAKLYSDTQRASFKGVNSKIINDPRIQNLIQKGAKTVAEVFQQSDKPLYEQSKEFLAISDFLKQYVIQVVK